MIFPKLPEISQQHCSTSHNHWASFECMCKDRLVPSCLKIRLLNYFNWTELLCVSCVLSLLSCECLSQLVGLYRGTKQPPAVRNDRNNDCVVLLASAVRGLFEYALSNIIFDVTGRIPNGFSVFKWLIWIPRPLWCTYQPALWMCVTPGSWCGHKCWLALIVSRSY